MTTYTVPLDDSTTIPLSQAVTDLPATPRERVTREQAPAPAGRRSRCTNDAEWLSPLLSSDARAYLRDLGLQAGATEHGLTESVARKRIRVYAREVLGMDAKDARSWAVEVIRAAR